MEGFNIESIKKEIDERRSKQQITEQTTGTGRMGAPRDSKKFLVDLLNSVNNNGAPTPAVQALRQVTEITDQRLGVPTTAGKTPQPGLTQPTYNNTPVQNYTHQPQQMINEGGERTDSYFDQQMQRGYDMLRNRAGGQTPQPNAGLSQVLTEYNNAPFVGTPQNGNMGVNAGALNEHIARTMNEMTNSSNFVNLVSEAYKNMINEMYTKEKIETALVEIIQSDTFKKIMKKNIVDTLLEIQNRNKPKV